MADAIVRVADQTVVVVPFGMELLSPLVTSASASADLAEAKATLAGHYANDATNTDVPGGSAGDRGAKYWSQQAALIGNSLKVRSPLMKIGAVTGTPAYVWPDANSAYVLAQLNANGQLYVDLHPDSPAVALIAAKVAAAILTGGFVAISPLSRLVGTAAGSPSIDGALAVFRDSAGIPMFAVGRDLTFWQSKYDSRIAKTVAASDRAEFGPIPDVKAGNVVLRYNGGGERTIWSSGTASRVMLGANGGFIFTDKLRGNDVDYSITLDGTVSAIQRDAAYRITAAMGHSALVGKEAAATADTIPPYPGQYLMLTDRPVMDVGVVGVRSPSAVLIDGKEITANGTVATEHARNRLPAILARHPLSKHVFIGSALQGATSITTSNYDTGGSAYNDLMNSIGYAVALVGGSGYAGNALVEAFYFRFGDSVNVSQASQLIALQAHVETGIRAKTGQIEAVPMFINQTATQSHFALTNSASVLSFVGHLDALAVSRTNNIYCVVPEYIGTFLADKQHPNSAWQDIFAQYLAKAETVVLDKGLDWVGVRPKASGWTVTSTYIDVPHDVQVGPLVIDTYFCSDPGNSGYVLTDGNGRTISGAPTVQPDGTTIRIPISGALASDAVLSYADSNGTLGESGSAAGPRGCVRDSDPAMLRNGTTHSYNPCVAFRQALFPTP